MSCPDCAGTGWVPPEMTEEHPRQSACLRCAALKQDQNQITPRDLFAAAALAGGYFGHENSDAELAARMFDLADAMMAERAKR